MTHGLRQLGDPFKGAERRLSAHIPSVSFQTECALLGPAHTGAPRTATEIASCSEISTGEQVGKQQDLPAHMHPQATAAPCKIGTSLS